MPKACHDDENERERSEYAAIVRTCHRIERSVPLIEACRQIRSGGYARYRGLMVDAYTASAIVAVYDGLGDANKAKYAAMDDVRKMADIAFRVMEKS